MIGDHSVLLIPDPDVQAWGPQLASNSGFDANLNGWGLGPFATDPWTWAAGWAVGAVKPDAGADQWRGWTLRRLGVGWEIPRTAAALYRIRTRVTVSAATPVVLTLSFGTTAAFASDGAFWHPTGAIDRDVWLNCPAAGTYVLEATYDPGGIGPEFAYLAPKVNVWPGTRPTPSAPRIDSIELQGQGGVATDITCLVDRVTIHHGREDTDSQPEAASCTLELQASQGSGTTLPTDLEVGGIIRVVTDLGAQASSVRFVGRVTDIALGWEDAGEGTPDFVSAQVVATAMLADLGRRVVGDVPWPQELDGARVARVLAAAGISLDPTYSDPGTVQVVPRDVDSQAALDVAQGTAESAGGIVWHTRTGEVRYADANHRRGSTYALALDSCDVLVTPTWRRSSEGLINLVSIGYGVEVEGEEQPRYTASRADSVDRYGRYELSAATELALLADATAMGQLLLTRNSSPVWVMAELPVDVKGLDQDRTVQLLALDVHSLLELTGLPVAGSAPTSAALWVEGWDEELAWGEHAITLTVSGYCRTSPAPQWDDSDPAWTWDSTQPQAMTWDDATCLGPQPNRGRWADVPASTRWNTVGGGVTWDTWK